MEKTNGETAKAGSKACCKCCGRNCKVPICAIGGVIVVIAIIAAVVLLLH